MLTDPWQLMVTMSWVCKRAGLQGTAKSARPLDSPDDGGKVLIIVAVAIAVQVGAVAAAHAVAQ